MRNVTVTIKKRSNRTAASKTLPSYKKPPVQEVAIGFVYAELTALKIPHIGILWEKFRKDFPLVEHAAPLFHRNAVTDAATGLPLPRIWFIDPTEARLIQIQNDRFYFNWRHRDDHDAYPRYENIAHQFKTYLAVFENFLNEMQLGALKPLELELTYINHIPKGQGWETVDNLSGVFTDLCWDPTRDRFLPKPTSIAWHASFALPEDKGQMRIRLSEAKRKSDSVPLIILELSAKGSSKHESANQMWDWYAVAHEWIVRGFSDITTPEIQFQHWEREDVSRS